MPSTHTSLHYHLVFSTHNRRPLICEELISDLHAFLGGIVRGIRGTPIAVGGIADHVHILMGLPADMAVANVIMQVKSQSTKWVRGERGLARFEWQRGYGAFTVSPSRVEAVKRYVLTQPQHHAKMSFQEEYVELLKEAGIEFEERYLW